MGATLRKTNWERNKDLSYGRTTKEEMSTHWRETKFKEETRKELIQVKKILLWRLKLYPVF